MKHKLTPLFALLLQAAWCWAASPSASFDKPTPSGRVDIKVKLERQVPEPLIAVKMFSLTNSDGKLTPISKVTPAGVKTTTDGVDNYSNARLIGKFNPAENYTLLIVFPDGSAAKADITATNAPPPTEKSLIQLDRDNFKMKVTPFTANGDGGIGLNYDISYVLNSWPVGRAKQLDVDLRTHGELSVTSENQSTNTIQNSLSAGLNARFLYNWRNTMPVGGEQKTFVYPWGVRVSPADFEMNKRMTIIDYTAKVAVGGALPYLDYPAVLWSTWNKLNMPFFPPTLFGGLTLVEDVKNQPIARNGDAVRARWDTEFIYDMPVANDLAFRFIWNSYVGLDQSFWKNYYEVGAVYYLRNEEGKLNHGLFFGYARGEMPPEFKRTDSWRLGYKVEF
jgi:hypothetical protein